MIDASSIADTIIAPAQRERVRVPNAGDGTTVSMRLWGSTIVDYGVALDLGGHIRRTPAQIRILGPCLPANVVRLADHRAARQPAQGKGAPR